MQVLEAEGLFKSLEDLYKDMMEQLQEASQSPASPTEKVSSSPPQTTPLLLAKARRRYCHSEFDT